MTRWLRNTTMVREISAELAAPYSDFTMTFMVHPPARRATRMNRHLAVMPVAHYRELAG
jgi:hypothetical protein